MNIDYEKVQQSINEYGIKILSSIRSQYSKSLTQEQLHMIEKLLSTNFIIVEKPSMEDIEFFSKQEGINEPENYSTNYIPSAHGGRTKGDNKIHIYPYTKAFKDYETEDEVVKSCIDNIVVHEIFHYFIRPNITSELDTIKIEFGHFITEGLVQYYTEEFSKRNSLGNPKSNYGKNVEFVVRLLNSYQDDFTQEQIDRMVFTCSQDELIDASKIGKDLYQEYADEVKFKKNISSFIKDICVSSGISSDDKKLKDIIKHYEKLENADVIFSDLIQRINLLFENNDKMKNKYVERLNKIFSCHGSKENDIDASIEQPLPTALNEHTLNNYETLQSESLEINQRDSGLKI